MGNSTDGFNFSNGISFIVSLNTPLYQNGCVVSSRTPLSRPAIRLDSSHPSPFPPFPFSLLTAVLSFQRSTPTLHQAVSQTGETRPTLPMNGRCRTGDGSHVVRQHFLRGDGAVIPRKKSLNRKT